MMDASDFIDGRRRAALAMLGLRASDRLWLLAQLPPAERAAVAALHAELERLKLPAGADLLAVAAATEGLAPEPALVEPGSADDGPLRALSRATAPAVHAVLCDEPDAVVARVLSLAGWHWRADLLRLLGDARAGRIGRLQREAQGLPPVVAQALATALAAAVQARAQAHGGAFAAELRVAQAPAAHSGRHWWSRWTR